MIKDNIQEQRWQKSLYYARQFIEREGHLRLPDGHEEDGYKLASWISYQRQAYKSGILAEERRQALEELDDWVWDPLEAAWRQGLDQAKRFVERERHARIPLRHIEDGFKLGSWVSRQRGIYKRGKLPDGHRQAMEALAGWTWAPDDAAWQKGLDYAKIFVEREGHARVPNKHVEDGFRLGQWANSQRGDYKRHELSPERREALEALDGWVWGQQDAAWQKGLHYAKRFVARQGHARVPVTHLENGFELGIWVNRQRKCYKKDKLSAERREALEALDGWTWDRHDAAWHKGLDYTKRFIEREGHARVPQWHVEDGFKLGQWVSDQRKANKRGRLPGYRRQALEALAGWRWDAHDAAWQKGLDYAKIFVEREGHARVPVKHVEDGFRLGQWANSQRGDYKRHELSPERREALEALDGWVWVHRRAF